MTILENMYGFLGCKVRGRRLDLRESRTGRWIRSRLRHLNPRRHRTRQGEMTSMNPGRDPDLIESPGPYENRNLESQGGSRKERKEMSLPERGVVRV